MNASKDQAVDASLLRLPYSTLIDSIIPLLDLKSLVQLGKVSKQLNGAVNDELVWRRRIQADFRFPITSSARTSGWKALYRGLSDPELFTWGDVRQDRLGVALPLHPFLNQPIAIPIAKSIWNVISRVRCMPFPLRIPWRKADLFVGTATVVQGQHFRSERPPNFDFLTDIPIKSIEPQGRTETHAVDMGVPVELHAGGWSFYALTHTGQILAWGLCDDNEWSTTTEQTFKAPTLLDLSGRAATSLSVGRAHMVAQMDDGRIWEWSRRWDRPAVHFLGSLLADVQAKDVVQIEAGWDFTAMLVHHERTSEVVVWKTRWTYETAQADWFQRSQQESESPVDPLWQVSVAAVALPTPSEPIQRIAAGDSFVVALAKSGAVYFLTLPEVRVRDNDQTPAAYADALRQTMVRNYTQWTRLITFEKFFEDDRAWADAGLEELVKDEVQITHVSAQFRTFAVYAPDAGSKSGTGRRGAVLLGTNEHPDRPVFVPDLQGEGVVKVVQGDWHSGALTADGRVLTWGAQSSGALGTWDSLDVPENALSLMHLEPRSMDAPRFRAGGMGAWRATGIFRNILSPRQEQSFSTDEERAAEEQFIEGMVKAERERFLLRRLPDQIDKARQVRFGFPRIGEERFGHSITDDDDAETKSVFDIAFAGWHSGALAVDRLVLGE